MTASGQTVTPLMLDLNGDGVHTVSISAGVQFDLTASGQAHHVGWVSATDGFLALDRNHDGIINDGSELFGQATKLADGTLAKDGFQALASLDTNGDGVVNALDAGFKDLSVWVDANQDGVTQSGELHDMASLGIVQLDLSAHDTSKFDNGNWIGLDSTYTTSDGHTHGLSDVWLQINEGLSQTLDLSKIDHTAVPAGSLAQIDASGNGHADTVLVTPDDVEKFGKLDLIINDQTGAGHVQMMINGDANDVVNPLTTQPEQWAETGTTQVDGETYQIFTHDNLQLLVGHKPVDPHQT